MKFRLWFLCIFALNIFHAQAQNSAGRISGNIVDPQNNPLQGSTVILYNVADTTSKQMPQPAGAGHFILIISKMDPTA